MIIRTCSANGCRVLTIGSRCVEHDEPVTRTFERGRPFRAAARASESRPVLVPLYLPAPGTARHGTLTRI